MEKNQADKELLEALKNFNFQEVKKAIEKGADTNIKINGETLLEFLEKVETRIWGEYRKELALIDFNLKNFTRVTDGKFFVDERVKHLIDNSTKTWEAIKIIEEIQQKIREKELNIKRPSFKTRE